jgi:hypothetical protein
MPQQKLRREAGFFQTALERLLGVGIGILGTGILFKDLILSGSQSVLWASDYDTPLIYWIVSWGYHILFEELNPLNFWNANSFYPNTNSLAYSDSMLSAQITFAPLRAAGIPPLLALYLTLAATCIANCILTKLALDRIGGFSISEKALIIFGSHFILSVTSFYHHYQLFGFLLGIPFFLFLYLYLRDLKARYLVIASLIFAVGVCYATYLAPILVMFAFFLSIPMVIGHIRSSGLRPTIQKIDLKAFGGVVLLAIGVYVIQLKPYLDLARSFPKASIGAVFSEASIYSANILSLFTGRSLYSHWYAPANGYPQGGWEFAYFPGYALLLGGLGFIAYTLFVGLKRGSQRLVSKNHKTRLIQVDPPPAERTGGIQGSFVLYTGILFTLILVLSWGPFVKWNNTVTNIRLPYYWIAQIFPGMRNIRTPGRLGMFLGPPLTIFTILFVRRLFSSQSIHSIASGLLLAAIIVESWPAFKVYPFSVDPDGLYAKIAQFQIARQALLELPVVDPDNRDGTIYRINKQLVGSTIHWADLVVGYGSKNSKELDRLLLLDWQLQKSSQVDTQPVVNFARKLQIPYFLIHLDQYSPEVAEAWIEFAQKSKVCVIWQAENTLLLLFSSSPCQ